MATCPSCASEVAEGNRFCGSCGAAIETPTSAPTETSLKSQPATTSCPSLDRARFIPGTVLAKRYRIISLLGRGGMGEVYRADDLKLGQPVALKFLPAAVEKDRARLDRFLNEVKIARQIAHPNVCRVYDVGEVDGHHFISMEYVDGQDLASLLHQVGRLPEAKATQIARQLCAGLAAAHEQQILHRDLKPANVMIDGRGRVRITDFGLAALAESVKPADVVVGTPTYMAPEQLAGKTVSVRSDLYSLGLVLYELFTGKRAFDATTPAELRRLHEESTPTSPSTHVEGLDASVERAVLRCLERSPADRPQSALEISAALPGGDPLAAALAAGETPSPEIVAAAGGEGTLRPWIATICFVFVLIALLGKPVIYQHLSWLSVVPLDLPPEALSVEAQRIIRVAGYPDRPLDSAYGFEYTDGFEQHAGEQEPAYAAEYIAEIQPAPVYFWYRQSPGHLTPTDFISRGGPLRVTEDDPPLLHPGMARVRLDPQGRLLRFDAVPPLPGTGEDTGAEPDWTVLFERAGIELPAFTPTQPTRVALSRYDVRQAWEGVFPGQPEVPIRIEAGAFQGRPVFFQVVTPWTPSPQGDSDSQSAGKRAANIVFLVIAFGILVAALPLARRNLTTGRGDRRSAFRTATCVLAAGIFDWVLRADHQFTFSGLSLFLHHVAWNVLGAGCVWVIYIALEPFVRRFWPRAIVSWNRLLQGRFRDPMVGRDILMGAAIGLLFNAPFAIWGILFPSGQLDPTTRLVILDGLVGVRQSVAAYFAGARNGLAFTVWVVLLLVLLRVVLRRPWAAVTVLFLLLVAPNTLFFGLPDVWPFWLHTALIVLALVRFGVLGCAAAIFFALPSSFVLTLDPTAWYVGRSVLTLLVLAAIAGYGFRISLAGRPLLAERPGQTR